jgi:hypothetical protein
MAKSGNTSYGLTVSLSDAEANAITTAQPAGQSASDKLSITAGSLLRDLARGGAMLGPEWATRVQAAIETTDPSAIVSAVEKSVSRQGEATTVQWIVDPTHVQFYQHLADNNGVTLEHELKSLLDYAYSQGWFQMGAPDVFKILLDAGQYKELQQMFSKDIVTGEDVMERLRKEYRGAFAPDAEDELVFDALEKK